MDKLITLDKNEINDITGRAFVVHAGEDDLGMGGKKKFMFYVCVIFHSQSQQLVM